MVWLNELGPPSDPEKPWDVEIVETSLLYPKTAKPSLPGNVTSDIAADFSQAHAVLRYSPKASAALSRRCLQSLIRSQEGIQARTLCEEVKQLLALNKLPRYLADDLDAIRVVGNFAAHPLKDTNTGEILDVEPNEAEWTLEVLGELIQFYFERQAGSRLRRERLQAKGKGGG